MRIIAALMDRQGMWVLGLIVGAIDMLLGFWIWTGIPISGLAIGLFVGIDLLIGGHHVDHPGLSRSAGSGRRRPPPASTA